MPQRGKIFSVELISLLGTNRGGLFIFDMPAYRIHKIVIAADTAEEACAFYREEIGGTLP
jgi:hypothetical protein